MALHQKLNSFKTRDTLLLFQVNCLHEHDNLNVATFLKVVTSTEHQEVCSPVYNQQSAATLRVPEKRDVQA